MKADMTPAELPIKGSRADDLKWELASFRNQHPGHRFVVGPVEWSYLRGGSGAEVAVVLPGALGATFTFQMVGRLEATHRILVPEHPRCREMTEVLEGLAALLDREGVQRAHFLGGSFGGLIAQAFVRRYPERTKSLVLSHTAAPDPRLAKRNAPIFWLVQRFPEWFLKSLLQRKLGRALKPLHDPERGFWAALTRDGIDSMSRKELLDRARMMSEWMKATRYERLDLSGWSGRILIIEGSGDPFVNPAAQVALRALYPNAAVHRFEGTGHSSSLAKVDEFVSVVTRFIDEVASAEA